MFPLFCIYISKTITKFFLPGRKRNKILIKNSKRSLAEHNSVDSCTWTELKIEIFFDHAGLNLVKIALTFGPYPLSWNICKTFFPVKLSKRVYKKKLYPIMTKEIGIIPRNAIISVWSKWQRARGFYIAFLLFFTERY